MNPSNKVPTLTQIAAVTGYSVATVSLVLRDKPGFTAETVEAIKGAAQSLGYAPNRFATALRPENSRIIGYLLPSNETDGDMERWAVYDLKLLTEFTRQADLAGYTVVVIPAGDFVPSQFSNLRAVYAPDHIDDVELEKAISGINLPLIAHNYHAGYGKIIDVYFAYRAAGLVAVKQLFDEGATKVGILIEPHVMNYVATSPAYKEMAANLPGPIKVYGREYRNFDATEILNRMFDDGVDAVFSNLEVGAELVNALSKSDRPEASRFTVIPTIDLAYMRESGNWITDDRVSSVAVLNSVDVYETLFENLSSFLESSDDRVALEIDVKLYSVAEFVAAEH